LYFCFIVVLAVMINFNFFVSKFYRNIRSKTIIQIQNMSLKLNMKDIYKIHCISKILKIWYEEMTHFCGNMPLWNCWKSLCHAFTSPSCSLREKSSLLISVVSPGWCMIINTALCQWLVTGRLFSQGTLGFLYRYNWRLWYHRNIIANGLRHP